MLSALTEKFGDEYCPINYLRQFSWPQAENTHFFFAIVHVKRPAAPALRRSFQFKASIK